MSKKKPRERPRLPCRCRVMARAAGPERRRQPHGRRCRVVAILVIVVGGYLLSPGLDTSNDVAAPPAPRAATTASRSGGPTPHTVVVYEGLPVPPTAVKARGGRPARTLTKLANEGRCGSVPPFSLLSQAGDYSERSAAAFSVVLEKSGPEVAKEVPRPALRQPAAGAGSLPRRRQAGRTRGGGGCRQADVKSAIRNLDGETVGGRRDPGRARRRRAGHADGGARREGLQDGRTMDELGQNLVDQVSWSPVLAPPGRQWAIRRDPQTPSDEPVGSSRACRRLSSHVHHVGRRRPGWSPSWPSGIPGPSPATPTSCAGSSVPRLRALRRGLPRGRGPGAHPDDIRYLTHEIGREMATGQGLRYAEAHLHAVHLGAAARRGAWHADRGVHHRGHRTPGWPPSETSASCCAGSTTSQASQGALRGPRPWATRSTTGPRAWSGSASADQARRAAPAVPAALRRCSGGRAAQRPHAGETTGPETVWHALRLLGAERIGHGTSSGRTRPAHAPSPRPACPLERLPSSNVATRAVGSLEEHPIRAFRDAGVTITRQLPTTRRCSTPR